jgi:hypothetical protein
VWIYWAVFFLTGAAALWASKYLDDRERKRWAKEAKTDT